MSNHSASFAYRYLGEQNFAANAFDNFVSGGVPIAQILVQPFDRFRTVIIGGTGGVPATEYRLFAYQGYYMSGREIAALTALNCPYTGSGIAAEIPVDAAWPTSGLTINSRRRYNAWEVTQTSGGTNVNEALYVAGVRLTSGFAGMPASGKTIQFTAVCNMIELRMYPAAAYPFAAIMQVYLSCTSCKFTPQMYERQNFASQDF